jgi:hypothetical protein
MLKFYAGMTGGEFFGIIEKFGNIAFPKNQGNTENLKYSKPI